MIFCYQWLVKYAKMHNNVHACIILIERHFCIVSCYMYIVKLFTTSSFKMRRRIVNYFQFFGFSVTDAVFWFTPNQIQKLCIRSAGFEFPWRFLMPRPCAPTCLCLLEAEMDYHALAHLLSETNVWWCSMLRPSKRNTKRQYTCWVTDWLLFAIPLASPPSSVSLNHFDTYWKLTRGFFFNVEYWITVASTTLKIVDKSHKNLNTCIGSFQRCPQHFRK